jgi:4-amino-4-deoxy-L-arabinose transferase-like glycosyltransferase
MATTWKLAAIVAVGAALRFYHLDSQSLWHDEAISVVVSRAPLDQMLGHFSAGPGQLRENNPPLYAYLLHTWFSVFGVSDFTARSLSAAAGVLCLPLIYRLTAILFGTAAGLCASLLLATSQLGVMLSQEARNYEVFLLLSLTTATLYWYAMSKRSLAAWCGGTATAVLMVLTNYYGVFVIAALAIHALLCWRNIPWSWVGGAALAGAGTLIPWARMVLGAQVTAVSGRVQPAYFATELSTGIATVNRFSNGAVYGVLESTPLWTFAVAALLFGGPLLYLVSEGRRQRAAGSDHRCAIVFALLLWIVPLGGALGLGLLFDLQYNVRYAAVAIAPYYMLVGGGLARLPHRTVRAIAIAAIVAYSGVALAAIYRFPYKENYRDAIRSIAGQAAPEDCYAFVPFGSAPLEWSIYANTRPGRVLKLDRELDSGCRRVWVVTYERIVSDAHTRWREWLATATAGFTKRSQRRFFWVRVEEYER